MVGFLLAAAGAACFPSLLDALGVRLDYGWPLATAVALGVLNSVYVLLIPSEHARLAQVRLHLWVQIIANLVILTVVVHFLGSVETAAPFMYLFHIILACVFFPPNQSLAVAATAVLLYCGCLALESAGVVRPATVVENLPLQTWDRDFLSGRFWSLRMGPLLAIWGVIWYVASRLSGAASQAGSGTGDHQRAVEGQRRGADPAHAADHARTEGALRRHPRQCTDSVERDLWQPARRGKKPGRANCRPLHDALPADSGHAAALQPPFRIARDLVSRCRWILPSRSGAVSLGCNRRPVCEEFRSRRSWSP